MASITKFEDLECLQLARELSRKIYCLTRKEKFSRDFSLVNQIRNSSGSAMDNIAEGFERGGNKEFSQFLSISRGSTAEIKSQLYRALYQKYIDNDEFYDTYNPPGTENRETNPLIITTSNHIFRFTFLRLSG